jgi:hypothetical protein
MSVSNPSTPKTDAEIAAAVLDALTSGHTVANSVGQVLHMIRNASLSGATSGSLFDKMDVKLSEGVAKDVTLGDADHSQLANTNEQTLKEFTANNDTIHLTIDAGLLLQETTVKIYEKTDGTNYEIISQAVFPTDFDGDLVTIELNGKGLDEKITLTSGTAEAGTITVPYNWVEENTA